MTGHIHSLLNLWAGFAQTSKALDAAVTELGKNGVISVFCAGNSGTDLNGLTHIHGLMANNPYAVIVSSLDASGNLADTSNYGDGIVTLGAPGVDIISCIQFQNAQYIPMMADDNVIYENFESGSTPLAIYQVDHETGDKVAGTDGAIVTSDEAMGFEGSHVISVPVGDSFTFSKYGSRACSIRIDFGKISTASAGDSFGFAYGGSDAMEIASVSDNEKYYFMKSHAGSWNICEYTLTDDDFTEANESSAAGTGAASDDAGDSSAGTARELSLTVTLVINDSDEVYFDTIGIGREKNLYVKGNLVETDDSGNIPFYDHFSMELDGEACVYSYTPGESSWKKCSAENVATTQLSLSSAGVIHFTSPSQYSGIPVLGVLPDTISQISPSLYLISSPLQILG